MEMIVQNPISVHPKGVEWVCGGLCAGHLSWSTPPLANHVFIDVTGAWP